MGVKRKSKNNQVEILVVEDSLTQAEQLKYILEQAGYRASVASNGKEALSLLRSYKPDLVISDIIMPEMDGFKLCQRIKRDKNLKDIPVILLTALSDPRDVIRGLECGADNFVTKPYDENYLLNRIQYILANLELHKQGKTEMGMEVFFGGQKYFVTSDRLQILNLLLSTYETAIQKNVELNKAQDELKALNEQLEQKVQERVKELSCIADLSRLAEIPWISIEEFVQKAVSILPPAWKYPEICSARITLDSKEFKTTNFRETEWCQTADIKVDRKKFGTVTVCYLEEKPAADEGPFLKEERSLINTVADFLGHIIQHRQTEAEIRDSEAKFRMIFDNANDGILLADMENKKFHSGNAAICRMLGYSQEEIKNMGVMDIHPEKDIPYVIEQFEKQSRKETIVAQNLPVKRKDGSVFYADVNSAPIEISGKLYLLGIFRDTTERRRAEESLKMFRTLIDQSNDAIEVVDLETGRFLDVNENGCKSLGYSREEFLSLKVYDIDPNMDLSTYKRVVEELRKAGFATLESLHRRKDGAMNPVEINLKYVQLDRDYIVTVVRDITDRKKAEEEIKQSLSLLKATLESTTDGILVVDIEGRITIYNQRFMHMWRIPEPILETKDDNKALSFVLNQLKEPDKFQSKVRELYSKPDSESYDLIEFKDGRVFERLSLPQRIGTNIVGRVWSFRDITERKKAEEVILSAAKEWSETFDSMVDGISIHSVNYEIQNVNETLCKMLGKKKEELTGKKCYQIFHRQDSSISGCPLKQLIKTKKKELVEIFEPYLNVWLSISCVPILDGKGEISRVVHVIHDITERKKAEEESRLSASRLEVLLKLNQMTDKPRQELTNFALEEAIHLTGSQIGYFAIMNEEETVLTMHSWSKSAMEECRVKNKPIIYPVETTGLWGEAVRQRRPIITNDYSAPNPWKKGYPEGHITVIRHMNVPVFDGDRIVIVAGVGNKPSDYDESDVKQLTLLMAGMWQIIKRKQTEEEIRRLNIELEQRVIERTSQLEVANKELEAFSYSVSHDLRAPLRAITGFSSMLLEDYADKLDDEGKRLLNTVKDNIQKMGTLIDDLLVLSRVGRKEIEHSKIDMHKLAKTTFDEIKATVPERELQLNIEPLLPAYGDAGLVHQVFFNLLSNAIKFTRTREDAVIEVGAYVEGPENIYYVKDNGIGFDMQYADKLFGAFQRLHSDKQFEGTGIGLAIVQRIIQRHGGRVWAEGKVNEGAKFYFTLPR